MGSSSQQNSIEAGQQSLFNTTADEAKQVFGQNSDLYGKLMSAFEPILAKGPSQEGFSTEEKTALNTEASSGVAHNFENAEKAVRGRFASAGGGNDYIPSGQEEQLETQVGEAAAAEEASAQNKITVADYEQGFKNYEGAVSGLLDAGKVFDPSIALTNSATGSGTAAANTANQIATQDNSWMGAVGGLVGQLGSGAMMAFGG